MACDPAPEGFVVREAEGELLCEGDALVHVRQRLERVEDIGGAEISAFVVEEIVAVVLVPFSERRHRLRGIAGAVVPHRLHERQVRAQQPIQGPRALSFLSKDRVAAARKGADRLQGEAVGAQHLHHRVLGMRGAARVGERTEHRAHER